MAVELRAIRTDPGHLVHRAGRAITTRSLQRLALPGVMALGAANVFWQLGSSSYYVDEILSVSAAGQPLGNVIHAVGTTEISPPGYFLLLHEWLGRASAQAEWAMRLPSALCAVLLVAVVYWLVLLLGERRLVALGAAAICALSPFELEYAQRAQGYAAVGLVVAVAVAAALATERSARRRSLWFFVSLAAALLSLLFNYTAGFVIAPLAVWVLTREALSRRQRWGFAAACTAVELALVPLLVTQHAAHAHRGVGASAALTSSTLLNMLEVPFGGRVNAVRLLGVVVTIGALVFLGLRLRSGEHGISARRLVVALAVAEPLVLIVMSAVGGRFWGLLMLNRYAAVAVPFIIVSIALAVERAPRPIAALLAIGVAIVGIAGTVENHRARSFYLDARSAAAYVRTNLRPGDVVVEPPYPWYQVPLDYYGLNRTHPVSASGAELVSLLRTHARRIWLLSALAPGDDPPAALVLRLTRATLARYRYTPLEARVFPSSAPLTSVLVAPVR